MWMNACGVMACGSRLFFWWIQKDFFFLVQKITESIALTHRFDRSIHFFPLFLFGSVLYFNNREIFIAADRRLITKFQLVQSFVSEIVIKLWKSQSFYLYIVVFFGGYYTTHDYYLVVNRSGPKRSKESGHVWTNNSLALALLQFGRVTSFLRAERKIEVEKKNFENAMKNR
jgi:hypothetical protein